MELTADLDHRQLELDGLGRRRGGLRGKRSGAVYGTHAYHTKVPPEIIADCIARHTEPGDLVLDPFCGSGMTGVAAVQLGRRAYLNDLSPAAVHIASNYTQPCDPKEFSAAVDRVLARAGDLVAAMYRSSLDEAPVTVEYLVWSDIRRCPSCGTENVLWEHRASGLRRIVCSGCALDMDKSQMAVTGETAVEANLSSGARRVTRAPIPTDLGIDALPSILPWYPEDLFDGSRPMWRKGHADLGIRTVADFYSRRNLAAMALLWDAASQEDDPRLRSALRFSLTAIANRASRRYQWNAKRPTNVLGGTLYVSSVRYEWNVLSLWKRKVSAAKRLFSAANPPVGAVDVHRGDAAELSLPDQSVDYCFTDPPFGGHIVYSDSSLLWEAWLGKLMDRDREAIITSTGDKPKSVEMYGGLLSAAFREIKRVLKPGRKATVVFQATDAAVWKAVQTAATGAGLALLDATTLDKGQPSFKQVRAGTRGERVAATDVVLTFLNGPSETHQRTSSPLDAAHMAIDAAAESGTARTTEHLFASINARLLRDGHRDPLSYGEVETLLEEHFVRDGAAWAVD